MVPMPYIRTWATFNAWREEQCRKRQGDKLNSENKTFTHQRSVPLAQINPAPGLTRHGDLFVYILLTYFRAVSGVLTKQTIFAAVGLRLF